MLILTNTSPLSDYQYLSTPGHVCAFISPPFEPLRVEARSRGEYFFQLEVSYRYCTHGWTSFETWSARRSAGNFHEKEHFRWSSGKKKLLGRAGRKVPSKFSINVPGARYVRWRQVGSAGVICDVSPDAPKDGGSRLRLWVSDGAPGPNETVDSYKSERPFIDLAHEPEVLQPNANWTFFQKSHLRP